MDNKNRTSATRCSFPSPSVSNWYYIYRRLSDLGFFIRIWEEIIDELELPEHLHPKRYHEILFYNIYLSRSDSMRAHGRDYRSSITNFGEIYTEEMKSTHLPSSGRRPPREIKPWTSNEPRKHVTRFAALWPFPHSTGNISFPFLFPSITS